MVKSVVRVHHWPPETIENLYLDDTDFFGLLYWYYDVLEEYRQPDKKK
jgi:hypothetical protein